MDERTLRRILEITERHQTVLDRLPSVISETSRILDQVNLASQHERMLSQLGRPLEDVLATVGAGAHLATVVQDTWSHRLEQLTRVSDAFSSVLTPPDYAKLLPSPSALDTI